MASEVFVQAFERGLPTLMRAETVMALVEPYVIGRNPDFAQLKTTDGGAELYGYGDDGGLLVVDPVGGEIWGLVFEIARVHGAAIIPIGKPPIVPDEEVLLHLPPEQRKHARVVGARRALMDALGF